jgi:hypothetical protein
MSSEIPFIMTPRRVMTLSSIPPRFAALPETLATLTVQAADEVRVYIPQQYRRFPDWDGKLPAVPAGVQIVRCERDDGPATKILQASRDFAGRDVQLLFCDDDRLYHPHWADRLYRAQQRRPQQAVAARALSVQGLVGHKVKTLGGRRPLRFVRLSAVLFSLTHYLERRHGLGSFWRRFAIVPGYGDVLHGVMGVVIRPEFFDDMTRTVAQLAWYVDDIWLSANLARRGIPIYCPSGIPLARRGTAARVAGLAPSRFDGKTIGQHNQLAARYCRDAFKIWQPA